MCMYLLFPSEKHMMSNFCIGMWYSPCNFPVVPNRHLAFISQVERSSAIFISSVRSLQSLQRTYLCVIKGNTISIDAIGNHNPFLQQYKVSEARGAQVLFLAWNTRGNSWWLLQFCFGLVYSEVPRGCSVKFVVFEVVKKGCLRGLCWSQIWVENGGRKEAASCLASPVWGHTLVQLSLIRTLLAGLNLAKQNIRNNPKRWQCN